MRALLAIALLLLAGCASSAPAEPPRPFRFAVVPAPAVGSEGGLDRLYAALDRLSTQAQGLDLILVPGPLLGGDDPGLPDELAGALGSFPAPTVVALAPGDAPAREALLEALERAFQAQPGARKPRWGWEPLPVEPGGELPEPAEAQESPPRRILVVGQGVTPTAGGGATLRVEVGPLALEAGPDGPRLALPALASPPHLLAVGTVADGSLALQLLSLDGPPPPPPPPLPLP